MAYEPKGKETVLNIIKITDCTEVRLTKVENDEDGSVSYDIRQWYCTKADPTKKPGKGIRIGEEVAKGFAQQILNG